MMDEYYEARKKIRHINYLTDIIRRKSKYSHLRFKCCGAYPSYSVPILQDESLDWVDQETFNKIEEDRIPLFVGCMGGPTPKFTPDFYNGEKIIANLDFSVLNGSFGCITFRKMPGNIEPETFKYNVDVVTKGCKEIEYIC